MTFEEAIMDPNRPLSLTPREWMYSVEASLAEEDELVSKAALRIAKEESAPEPETGLEKIDMGIDQMVQAVQLIQSGIQDARMTDMESATRRAVEKIRDLLETAVAPYLADMITCSDSLEDETE